eukprot:5620135-Amphidinium_carterae.1
MSVEHRCESLSQQNSMKKYSGLHSTGDDFKTSPSTINESCLFSPEGTAVVLGSTIPRTFPRDLNVVLHPLGS